MCVIRRSHRTYVTVAQVQSDSHRHGEFVFSTQADPVLSDRFVGEVAERLEEYSSGSFVGFGGSSECNLEFSLGHVSRNVVKNSYTSTYWRFFAAALFFY